MKFFFVDYIPSEYFCDNTNTVKVCFIIATKNLYPFVLRTGQVMSYRNKTFIKLS